MRFDLVVTVLAAGIALGGCERDLPDDDGSGPPVVVSTLPTVLTRCSRVPTIDAQATFSEDIDPDTIDESTFVLTSPAGSPVIGSVVYAAETRTAQFHSTEWHGQGAYRATITTGVTDLDGSPLSTEHHWSFSTCSGQLIETDDTGDAYTPRIAISTGHDSASGGFAVWLQRDGSRTKLWANRLQPLFIQGAPHGSFWETAELLATDPTGSMAEPQIAARSGTAIAVWQMDDEGTGTTGIWANRSTWVDSGGPGTWAWNGAELIDADGAHPQIAVNLPEPIAVWETAGHVRSARYLEGSGWGPAEQLDDGSPASVDAPQIAVDLAGNAIVIWAQSDPAGRQHIWANQYLAGVGWGAAERIEPDTASVSSRPQLVAGSSWSTGSSALAAWERSDGIWTNRYLPGSGWGTAERIATGSVDAPRIGFEGGNAIVVWAQSDGTHTSIWANRCGYGAGWGTPEPIATDLLGNAAHPRITGDGASGTTVVWAQSDGIRTDIWASAYDGVDWTRATPIAPTVEAEESGAAQLADGILVWSMPTDSGRTDIWTTDLSLVR